MPGYQTMTNQLKKTVQNCLSVMAMTLYPRDKPVDILRLDCSDIIRAKSLHEIYESDSNHIPDLIQEINIKH